MNKQKQKIIAVLLVFMMMMTILPTAPAFAADNYSYTAGAFTIISNEPLTAGLDYSCQNYSSDTHEYNYNILTINTEKPITIRNTNSVETHDSIVVAAGVSANITLAGVNISTYVNEYHSTYHPALQIADGSTGNVTITLADGTTNTLIGGYKKAGLQKNGDRNTGMLTIKGGSLGTGTLYAEGGGYGAGIGGAYQNTASNITINKAIVTAQGGVCAAGIGGGGSDSGSPGMYGKAFNIKIIDSIVTATGGNQGAGIGGGNYGNLVSLQISGGSVKAVEGAGAKTLGSGALSNVGYVHPTDNGTGTGHQLYLLTIANPTGETVMIDGKEYAIKQHSSDDTNLYVYLTGTEHTVYTTKTLKYALEDKENVNAPELFASHTHVDSDSDNKCDECSAATKSIMFDKNNDISDSATMEKIVLDVDTDNSYILPECAFTAPENKYFKGWATEANGEVITGSKITVSGNMTLYAVWGNKYSITFNSNGGNGTMESKTVIEGTEYTLPECTFTPLKDHYFLGWAESEAGSMITDETITVNKDIELYAIWKEMLFDGEKTTLDISKGKVEIGADSLNAYASDGTNLTTPDYDGYIITGSSTSTSNTVFADRVYVEISGGSHKITLRDLSIDVSSLDYATAFMINNAQVELKLEGTNSLASGKGYAALNLEGASATLTITADSTGSLTANGGENAAGIGPTNGKTCGDITIAGGNINIVDDNDSVTADIGVGNSGNCGTISITGGKFGSGDVSANKVYGVAVAACSSVRDSGDTTYPYLVSQDNHTDTRVVANNNGTHDVIYACCGTVKANDEKCELSTATCQEKAKCFVCEAEYGDFDAEKHTSAVKYANNAVGTHKKVYECCGANVTEACFGGTATCTTQAVCEYCSTAYGDVLGHDYAFTLTQGETTHYYDCSRCDINKDEAAHSYTNWASNDDGTHTGTCVCGKTSKVDCSYGDDYICDVCGYDSTPESGGENPGEGEGGNEGGTTNPDEGEGGGDTTTPSNPSTSTGGGGFSGTYNYPVSTPTTDNGSVSLSDSNASAGETVTATVKPDKGYGVAEVIVTDDKGNVIPVTYLGNGEYSFVMPAGKVNIETICKPAITLTIGSQMANVFGKTVKNDVAPIIVDGRTMLPIRFVAEALGADVSWNEDTQTVTITKDGTVVEIIIGADYAYINGERVELDSPAFIANSRTYLPVRFVAEALGADVNWDAVTQQVVIMK